MKINFKVLLHDLEGEVFDENENPIFINKQFANILGSNPHTDTGIDYMDAFEWAMKINKGEDLDLSKSEQEKLKNFIIKSPNITGFAKKDLLNCFEISGE